MVTWKNDEEVSGFVSVTWGSNMLFHVPWKLQFVGAVQIDLANCTMIFYENEYLFVIPPESQPLAESHMDIKKLPKNKSVRPWKRRNEHQRNGNMGSWLQSSTERQFGVASGKLASLWKNHHMFNIVNMGANHRTQRPYVQVRRGIVISFGGVPWPWGYPNSWRVYRRKSHLEMDDDWGYPHFRNLPFISII